LSLVLQEAVKAQGRRLVQAGQADPAAVAVDQTLIPAQGRTPHRGRRAPRGADLEGGWGFSEHHQWVYGSSLEVVVTATEGSLVVPLLASVGPGNAAASTGLLAQVKHLPAQTQYALGDRAYDTNACGEAVEYAPDGTPTGRHLVCPLIGRAGKPKVGRRRRRGRRERLRRRRAKRLAFFQSVKGRRLYDRRRKTVEPFMEWFKHKFDLHDRVWHRGLPNNQTQLLLAVLAYQLLVRYHHRAGGLDACVQWILDGL